MPCSAHNLIKLHIADGLVRIPAGWSESCYIRFPEGGKATTWRLTECRGELLETPPSVVPGRAVPSDLRFARPL